MLLRMRAVYTLIPRQSRVVKSIAIRTAVSAREASDTSQKKKAVGKTFVAESIQRDTFLKKELVDVVFDQLIASIKREVGRGNTVALENFGTFYQQVLKSRRSMHPKTGEVIQISEKKKLAFKSESDSKRKEAFDLSDPAASTPLIQEADSSSNDDTDSESESESDDGDK